jgi:bacteriocin-like protein
MSQEHELKTASSRSPEPRKEDKAELSAEELAKVSGGVSATGGGGAGKVLIDWGDGRKAG